VSLVKAYGGEDNCGCFGPVPVSPRLTLGFDFAGVIALIFTRPPNQRRLFSNTPGALRIGLALVGSAAILGMVGVMAAGRLTSGEQQGTLWEPRAWAGNPLPILEEIDDTGKLGSGEWVLMFYRRGCGHCRSELAQLLDGLSHQRKAGETWRLAVVEVPPGDGEDPLSHAPPGLVAARARLSPGPRRAVQTPLFLQLQDSIVCGYFHSADDVLLVTDRRGGDPEN
jgi:hypothetical protein